MDARSIAATAANKGFLTAATDIDVKYDIPKYFFDKKIYDNRVYDGILKPDKETKIKFGPNIVPWPEIEELSENIMLRVVSEIHDPVTTTDELIPSGETSSYRSNPLGLAEYTLSRKDPEYVGKAKEVRTEETNRVNGAAFTDDAYDKAFEAVKKVYDKALPSNTEIGSTIYAVKPGDGSAREQAASCQRVLGGLANIAKEYATKRYRSNLINWGMLPFIYEDEIPFKNGDFIFVNDVKNKVKEGAKEFEALVINKDSFELATMTLKLADLTSDEKEIITKGCLINFNRK